MASGFSNSISLSEECPAAERETTGSLHNCGSGNEFPLLAPQASPGGAISTEARDCRVRSLKNDGDLRGPRLRRALMHRVPPVELFLLNYLRSSELVFPSNASVAEYGASF